MSDDRSVKAKARWSNARKIADAMVISVTTAWINLGALEKAELIDPIIEGIDEAIELAQEIIVQPRNIDFKSKAEDVKLMLWVFDKIGDVKRIEAAFKKAMVVIE